MANKCSSWIFGVIDFELINNLPEFLRTSAHASVAAVLASSLVHFVLLASSDGHQCRIARIQCQVRRCSRMWCNHMCLSYLVSDRISQWLYVAPISTWMNLIGILSGRNWDFVADKWIQLTITIQRERFIMNVGRISDAIALDKDASISQLIIQIFKILRIDDVRIGVHNRYQEFAVAEKDARQWSEHCAFGKQYARWTVARNVIKE